MEEILNEKQTLFVLEYMIDFNATQAAIRAGYSKETAYSIGQRLLKNVEIKRQIEELKAERVESLKKTREDVISDLELIINEYKLTGKLTSNALRAIELLLKSRGWNEPDKSTVTHQGINITIVKPNQEIE